MREVDFGRDALPCTRRGTRVGRALRAVGELPAYLLGFVFLERAGVGLAYTNAELVQHVENLPAFDFQLSRKIVDSNLTHPPLFKMLPKAVSCS
jgi:hypothetical protein